MTKIATTVYGEDKSDVVHVPQEGEPLPQIGDKVTAAIDWDIRLKRMRIHTALHLLTTVLPYPVTGGVTFSFGGVQLDTQARVVNTCNEPIKGPAVRPNETNNPKPGALFRSGVVPGVAGRE